MTAFIRLSDWMKVVTHKPTLFYLQNMQTFQVFSSNSQQNFHDYPKSRARTNTQLLFWITMTREQHLFSRFLLLFGCVLNSSWSKNFSMHSYGMETYWNYARRIMSNCCLHLKLKFLPISTILLSIYGFSYNANNFKTYTLT